MSREDFVVRKHSDDCKCYEAHRLFLFLKSSPLVSQVFPHSLKAVLFFFQLLCTMLKQQQDVVIEEV